MCNYLFLGFDMLHSLPVAGKIDVYGATTTATDRSLRQPKHLFPKQRHFGLEPCVCNQR